MTQNTGDKDWDKAIRIAGIRQYAEKLRRIGLVEQSESLDAKADEESKSVPNRLKPLTKQTAI